MAMSSETSAVSSLYQSAFSLGVNVAVYLVVSPTFGIVLPESAQVPLISVSPNFAVSPLTVSSLSLSPKVPLALPVPLTVRLPAVMVNVQSSEVIAVASAYLLPFATSISTVYVPGTKSAPCVTSSPLAL